ncbi:MAG: hypothetical protein ACKKL6_03965 [Candidatus Komeilibacteria bacterium]
MNKNIIKLIIIFLLISVALPVGATSIGENLKQTGGQAYYNSAGEAPGVKDPAIIVGNAIQIALGFIGVIFTILILISGYQWMTAGGNSTAIDSAKKRMVNAIIGLVITLAVFGITDFVIEKAFTLGGRH